MRITILQGAFFPVPPVLGGAVEKVWFALGKEFAKRGHQVTHVSRRHGAMPAREVIEGVEHRRVEGFDSPRSLVRLKACDLLYTLRARKVLPEADILVTNTFWAPLVPAKPRWGQLYVNVNRYPRGQYGHYGRAARLQAVSTHIGEAIAAQAPALAGRVTVIPNPLQLSDIGPLPTLPAGKPVILFVGRVHPEKGVHLLIEAFRRLGREASLLIVGPWAEGLGGGGEAYQARLLGLAAGADVTFAGPVFDAARLNRLYAEATFFVYPSLAGEGEALPLAPLESMANGCPPLLSRLRCFDDYLRDNVNGFSFDHTAPDPALALAERMDGILADPALREKARAGCLETARRFTLPRVADLYLADFEKLLA